MEMRGDNYEFLFRKLLRIQSGAINLKLNRHE